MNKLLIFLVSISLFSSCSFKIPAGTYTTAPPPSSGNFAFAGHDLTLTENGRFQFRFWSDDGAPLQGHGGYVIFGKNLFLLFENSSKTKAGYIKNEIACTSLDSQLVNFKINEINDSPLIGVSIYNRDDHTQGTISHLDGTGHLILPKVSNKRTFELHYMGYDQMEIEIEGDVCLDLEISMNEKMEKLQLGDIRIAKLKRKGDQFYIKMQNWREFNEIYLRE